MNYTRLIAVSTALLVLGIAIVSFTLSYNVLQKVAEENGVGARLSYLWPLLVDASLVTFSLAIVHAYLQSESPIKQWGLVGLYTLGTIAFNIAHADATIMSRIVAGIPPVSLFFSFEMLMRQFRLSIQRHEIACKIEEMETISQKLAEQIVKQKDTINKQNTILVRKKDQIELIKSSSAKPIKKLQEGKQNKIAKRREFVSQLLAEGLDENAILQKIGVKDLRTVRGDIESLNGNHNS